MQSLKKFQKTNRSLLTNASYRSCRFSLRFSISYVLAIGTLIFVGCGDALQPQYPLALSVFETDNVAVFSKPQVFRGERTYLMVCSFQQGTSTLRWFDLNGGLVREHQIKDSVSDVISSNDFVLQATHFATGLNGIYRIGPNKTTIEVQPPNLATFRDYVNWKQDGHQFICYHVVNDKSQKTYSVGALCLNMDTHFERVWNHNQFTPTEVDRGWILKKVTPETHELVLSTSNDSLNCALVVRASPPVNSLRIWAMNAASTGSGLSGNIKWIGTGDFDSDLSDEIIGITNQDAIVIADGYFQNVVYSRRLGAPFSNARLRSGLLGNDGFTDIVFSFSTQSKDGAFTTLIEPAMDRVSPVSKSLNREGDFFDVFFLQTDFEPQTTGLLFAEQQRADFFIKYYNSETGTPSTVLNLTGSLIDYYPLDVPESNFLYLIVTYEREGKIFVSIEKTDLTYFKFF